MKISGKYFYPLGIILILFILQTSFLLFADLSNLVDLIPDDAAYYFKIAENFNKGMGFSFDGLHQTNGFQPLWQYILIAVYFILPSDRESFYRIALIIQTLLVSGSSFMLWKSIYKINGESNSLIALGIVIILVFSQAVNGMESALVVFMVVLLYSFYSKNNISSSGHFFTGIITGVLILSRLDFIFLPVIMFLLLIPGSRIKKSLLYLSGCLLIFIPYALNNYFHTGHFQPISGVLKSSFPDITFNFDLQFTATALISIFASVTASLIYTIFHFKKIKSGKLVLRKHHLLIVSLALTVLLHYSFYLLFIKWPVLNYYFIFYGLVFALISADLLKIKINKILVILFLLLGIGFVAEQSVWRINKDITGSWHARAYDAALWARNNTDPGAVFAMKDAGNFSFLSGRKVINLDGLVNDFYFQEVLKEQELQRYLKLNKVSYYVLYEASGAEELLNGSYDEHNESFMSYKFMLPSDTLSYTRYNEVYRDIFNNSALLIWKIN